MPDDSWFLMLAIKAKGVRDKKSHIKILNDCEYKNIIFTKNNNNNNKSLGWIRFLSLRILIFHIRSV